MKQNNVALNRYPIKLGQFLKFTDLVSDGIEAKLLIQNGQVSVNGEIETRRGRQLRVGDEITIGDTAYICS